MKIVDRQLLTDLTAQAVTSPRLRKNFNLHDGYQDPIQRLLNALEPGTYIRPHRHPDGVWELFILLYGGCSVLLFDDDGRVTDRIDMQTGDTLVMEVPVRAWHAVAVTQPGTMILEAKPGPYSPVDAKDFARWAPEEGQPGCDDLCRWMERASLGDQWR